MEVLASHRQRDAQRVVARSGQRTKLLENTYRAVNIALANEFSDAAEELSVDIIEVI